MLNFIKYLLGLDKAPVELQAERIKICNECKYQKNERCVLCHCPIFKKTSVRSSVCDAAKW